MNTLSSLAHKALESQDGSMEAQGQTATRMGHNKPLRSAMLLLTLISATTASQSAWATCVGCDPNPYPPTTTAVDPFKQQTYYVDGRRQPDWMNSFWRWEYYLYLMHPKNYPYTFTCYGLRVDCERLEFDIRRMAPGVPVSQSVYTGVEKIGFTASAIPSGRYALAVSTTGSGQVTKDSAGPVIWENYAPNTVVTLTAIPNSGQSFTGWSGDCAGMSFTTSVTMDKNKVCTANFYPIPSVISGKVFNDANGNGIKDANETGVADWAVVAEAFVNERNTDMNGNKYGPTALTNQAGEYTLQNLSLPGHYAVSIEDKAGWIITTPNPAEPFDLLVWRKADGTLQYEGFRGLDFGVIPTFPLTVTKIGTGSVKSTDGLINCGGTCQGTYATNKSVSLQATAGTGFKFDKWTGTGECNNSTANPIAVTMNAAKSCSANFVAIYTLTVIKTGKGTVNGGGNFIAGATVKLTATPATGYTLQGWTPSPCANSFVMPASNLSCTATFVPILYTVTPSKTGNGTVSGGGNFAAGVTVKLTAIPATGYTLQGWSPSPCASSFVMPASNLSCTATFVPTYTLIVSKSGGNSTSTVTSTPTGISCGSDCSEDYVLNQSVSLQATAGTGFKFDKWTGRGECNNSTVNPINVKMTAAKTCTANFVCSPMLSVSPTSQSFSRAGGSFVATVNVGSCPTFAPIKWAVSSNSSWLTVSPTSGTGNGTVQITATKKPIFSPVSRTGTITITATGVTGSPQNIVVRQ
jgi:hypothetical protein